LAEKGPSKEYTYRKFDWAGTDHEDRHWQSWRMIRILLIPLGDVILNRKISGGNIIDTLPLFAELASLYEHAGDPDDVIIGRYLHCR